MHIHFQRLRTFLAGLVLAAAALAPLSAAATALPTVDQLVAKATSAGSISMMRLESAIKQATSDPAERMQLAKAVAEAAVKLASTDPTSAVTMIRAASRIAAAGGAAQASPLDAAAVGTAILAVANNAAVLNDTNQSTYLRDTVKTVAQIASSISKTNNAAATTLAAGARAAAAAVDNVAGYRGAISATQMVNSVLMTFVTSQVAGDGSPNR